MKCDNCGAEISANDSFQHAGQTLCEDCYLYLVATPRVCDPWAVHSAKKATEEKVVLTPLQGKIMSLIKEKGPLTIEEICQTLKISETEFRANFASLRHMELARACKEGEQICYTVFK
jgi:predicted transcriptional regulator